MKIIRFLILALITGLLVFILDNRPAEIPFLSDVKSLQAAPALGSFLNPFGGFWANAESKSPRAQGEIQSDKLKERVDVLFDERLVPHIFAKNDHDLYFAQGYVTAQYRLWQMEFQTHFAAGRLSEIVGAGALDIDRFQRKIGMLEAAKTAVAEMQKDPLSKLVVEAYTEGVNAYIESLSPRNYPLEYKLLGYAPEKWTTLKCALLLKYMAQDLSYANSDLAMTKILEKYGDKVTRELFPNYTAKQDPIIPPDTDFKFKKKDIPKKPKLIHAPLPLDSTLVASPEDRSGIGSNNWAISGDKSASGYPILSNDPHLSLNLPSIWFEIQLVAPKVNVYGVSLPGAPGVTIGFNDKIAWGVTNVATDVTDWYKITFQDESRQAYKYGEEWRAIETRVDTFKVKGGEPVIESTAYTHFGPITASESDKDQNWVKNQAIPIDCALRWVAHDPSQELLALYKLNRAENYKDYREALTFYSCPAQNFIFADVNKDIAITPNGKYPLKWEEQGKFVLDGSKPEHDWQGWIPPEQNPHVKNPPRGFVSSANQFPVSDSLYPYYLHWKFATYERGARINQRLANLNLATPDSLRTLQNDDLSLFAKDVLPRLLEVLADSVLIPEQKKAKDLLAAWDYHYAPDKIAPSIFKEWWTRFEQLTWEDDLGEAGMRFPSREMTLILANRRDSLNPVAWFDDVRTEKVEGIADIALQSFRETIQGLKEEKGELGDEWAWGKYRNTRILHLSRQIPAFSRFNIMSPGDKTTVNATGPRTGPSWRMVVALGKRPQAFGIYPGGQSGNPGSHFYDNFINSWAEGRLAPLQYLRNTKAEEVKIIRRLKMSKD